MIIYKRKTFLNKFKGILDCFNKLSINFFIFMRPHFCIYANWKQFRPRSTIPDSSREDLVTGMRRHSWTSIEGGGPTTTPNQKQTKQKNRIAIGDWLWTCTSWGPSPRWAAGVENLLDTTTQRGKLLLERLVVSSHQTAIMCVTSLAKKARLHGPGSKVQSGFAFVAISELRKLSLLEETARASLPAYKYRTWDGRLAQSSTSIRIEHGKQLCISDCSGKIQVCDNS